MSSAKGPRVARYIGPLLDVLRDLDGSAKSREATEAVVERVGLTEAEQAVTNESGQTQAYNDIAWARFYLVKTGLIDSSKRGVWTLTGKGQAAEVDDVASLALVRSVQQRKAIAADSDNGGEQAESASPAGDADEEAEEEELGLDDRLITVLRKLSPHGFERLCRRLLLEAGFERVEVTPQGRDGGIDGVGMLPVSPFVTFKVMFQCKRYAGAVSAPQIRDFQAATFGRAEKGLFLTTGSFTSEASKEARRDGAPPIELIDGRQLVELFRKLELGLKPRIAYDIDEQFFAQFRD